MNEIDEVYWCGYPVVILLLDMQIIQDDSEENKWRIGALRALAQIFKQGGREILLPQAPIVFESIKRAQLLNSPVTLVRKIAINIVQRIG